jgi:2-desacetyl-2-hydroxyethyl bacteriochlorophyllide A dehydrogenase
VDLSLFLKQKDKISMQQVVFHGPNRAALEDVELDQHEFGPSEIVIQSLASLISQGTEGAAYQGLMMPGGTEQRYPQRPGYANVARVIEVGSEAPFTVGDRVFTMSNHASHARIDTKTTFCVRIPEDLPAHAAVFTRLAMVSMSTLRTSTARLGDKAAVVGLGLVGNLAAQLCQIAGMTTTGVDLIPWRCELARECGIANVLQSPSDDQLQPEHQLVIEATGSTGGAMTGIKLAQRHGELSLVGSQWGVGSQNTDFLRVLGTIFERYIHIRSGWEWQLPILPTTFGPSSLTHNASAILEWLSSGKLVVEPMLSHRVSPADANEVYGAMVSNKDKYLGVVFEWSA